MGLSRNKVAVPEGAAGTPPFWRRALSEECCPANGFGWCLSLMRGSSVSGAFLLVLTVSVYGGLAQLARALAWHARGHRFDPDILHFEASLRLSGEQVPQEFFDILTQARL